MEPLRLVVAVILFLAGATFVGQGLGILRGSSFMVDDVRWAVIGAVLVVVALAVGWRARRRRGAA